MASDNKEGSSSNSKKRAAEPFDDGHKRVRFRIDDTLDNDSQPSSAVPLSSSRSYTHADYTVGWICALPLEMRAAKAMLDEEHPGLPISSNDHNTYLLGSISGHNVVIACLPAGIYGTTTATIVAVSMSSTFPNSTKIPLLVGIGGGVPSDRHDIRLGDIVVSTPSSDYPAVIQYDRGKTVSAGVIDSRGTLNKPRHVLLTAIAAFQAQYNSNSDGVSRIISQTLNQDELASCEYPGVEADILYHAGCLHTPESTACEQCGLQRVKRAARKSTSPVIHYGTVGSGNQVIKHAATRDQIATKHGDILCFEMEAAGIMDYIPCLVIRGICDYADAFKSKEFQGYAALAAAAFGKELLTFMSPRTHGGNQSKRKSRRMLKDSVLGLLSFLEADRRRMTIKNAHQHTCAWLLDTPEYLEWTDIGRIDKHHGLLWIKGKPGTGKSTLMKFLLDRFEMANEQDGKLEIISFFFNARGQSLEKSTIGMYRSLIHQLLTQIPESCALLEVLSIPAFREGIQQADFLELLFRKVVVYLKSRRILCLIDALDECPEDEIRDMVDCFKELGNVAALGHFQICFSSRHYPNISIDIGLKLVLEEEHGHDRDILNYIDSELQFGDGKHAQELKDNIFKKSNGIFLWVCLVTRILKREYMRGRVHTLNQTLQAIPEGLDALLADILLRDTRNISELVLCMRWILYAKRPLERQELYFALLSAPGTPVSWPSAEISTTVMDNYILDCSKGLAELTRTTPPVVQFIHESVREVLLQPSLMPKLGSLLQELDQAASHQYLAECCQNYLLSEQIRSIDIPFGPITRGGSSFLEVHRSTAEGERQFPFLEYSVQFFLNHANHAASMGVSQAKFLQTFHQDNWLGLRNILTKRGDSSFGMLLARLDMQSLLVEWSHTVTSTDQGEVCDVIDYLGSLANREACLAIHQGFNRSPTASSHGSEKYFNCIYQLLMYAWSGVFVTQQTTRSLARLLIANGAQRRKDDVVVALNFAALNKEESIIKLLLNQGAPMDSSTLVCAAREPEGFRKHMSKPWLAQKCTETCLRLLVSRGSNINSRDSRGMTALHAASSWATASSVEYLVNISEDIDAVSSEGGTALYYAVAAGNIAAVLILLAEGSQVDIQNSYGRTPLHCAVELGNNSIIDYLLEHGASINITDKDGNTPLHLAIYTSMADIVEQLLANDASFWETNNMGHTPLQLAIFSGRARMVELMLQTAEARTADLTTARSLISWAIDLDSRRSSTNQHQGPAT